MVAYTIVAVALFLAFLPASLAATGDTWTADLSGSTLPPGSSFVKGKGTGTMTITEQDGDLFFWEIDLFGTSAFNSLSLVLGAPGIPSVLTLATSAEYIPGEIVYFGNFTRQYLDEQLQANGFDETALYGSDSLWALASLTTPPNSAISGQVTSNAIADFNTTTALAPGAAPEDTFELSSSSVYVAQMQNTTIPLFETGMTETNGTGSVLIQDLQDGSYLWNLDLTNFLRPAHFEIRYFSNLSSQPTVLKLDPNPKFNRLDESYEGNFTVDALRAGLTSIGAPPEVVDKGFNVTPPVLFLKLDDTRNGSVVGFVFDANAEPTERPIVKGGAFSRATGWIVLALPTVMILI